VTGPQPSRRIGRRAPAARAVDGAFDATLAAAAAIGLVALATLLVVVLRDGAAVLDSQFLTSFASSFPDRAGVRAGIIGSLLLVAVCVAVILPLGVATAVYLEEYADRDRWWLRVVEANIANLAAVPSIVYGILGLAVLVRGPLSLGPVLLAGGLTLGLLVLPTVIITARDALRAVPPSIREAGYALGATRWQVTRRLVLPAAVPGIATGLILAIADALGQAAPLIMVGAAAFIAFDPSNPLDIYTALPIQIFEWTGRPQPEFQALAAAGILVLLALLLLVNGLAIWLRQRYARSW